MTSKPTIHTVAGHQYKVWSDYIKRGTFAEAEDGTVKQISGSGYISKDLTIRKEIALRFNLPTFRR